MILSVVGYSRTSGKKLINYVKIMKGGEDMFKNLFAACLLVDDFDRSFNFYKNTLGLEMKSRDGKFADFDFGNASIAIFEKSGATAMFPTKYMGKGGGVVLAVQVKDFNGVISKLKAKRVEIFEGPKTTAWGQTVAYFKDPDGNIWEVSQKQQ